MLVGSLVVFVRCWDWCMFCIFYLICLARVLSKFVKFSKNMFMLSIYYILMFVFSLSSTLVYIPYFPLFFFLSGIYLLFLLVYLARSLDHWFFSFFFPVYPLICKFIPRHSFSFCCAQKYLYAEFHYHQDIYFSNFYYYFFIVNAFFYFQVVGSFSHHVCFLILT